MRNIAAIFRAGGLENADSFEHHGPKPAPLSVATGSGRQESKVRAEADDLVGLWLFSVPGISDDGGLKGVQIVVVELVFGGGDHRFAGEGQLFSQACERCGHRVFAGQNGPDGRRRAGWIFSFRGPPPC